jgi:hypothetical protein
MSSSSKISAIARIAIARMERLVEPEPKDEHVSDGRIKQFLNSCEEWRRNPGQSAFAGVILKMPAFTGVRTKVVGLSGGIL